MKRTQIVIAVMMISLLVAGSAFADNSACPVGRDKAGYKDKMDSFSRDLKLTPEQDKMLKDAKQAHRSEMEGLGKAMKAKRQELQAALAAPGVTKQQVEPIAAQIKALQAQMIDSRIDGILKIKSILSPEQYQKLQAMKAEWRKNGNKKHSEKNEKEW